jgi:FlgD Ig-like domain
MLAVMFAATVAALVLSQRIKDEPVFLHRVKATRRISPNADGYHDKAVIRFVLGRPDVVSVAVAGPDGRIVRHLARNLSAPAGRKIRFRWTGRTDSGALAPDGTYTVRVTLTARPRTIELHKRIRLRNVAPHYRPRSRP